MQAGNRFLDFAEQVIARHRGLGFGFEPAAMLYLEDQEQSPLEQASPNQSIITNLYHIQNIKEENYLFRQNLTFLTQILENKMYQNLYPSVEKQIEKVIREEMPQAETKIINSVSQELYRLVQQGGIEQFEIIRDKLLSEHTISEKTTLKEQEQLFRKIENIWNSSIYHQAVHNHHTTIQNNHSNIKNNSLMVQNSQQMIENQQISVQQNYLSVQNYLSEQNLQNTQNIQHDYQIYQAEIVHPETVSIQETEIQSLEHSVQEKETEYRDTVYKETKHREKEYRETVYKEIEHKESLLERALKLVETQNQILISKKDQGIGNLGKSYRKMTEQIPLEYIQEQPVQQKDESGQILQQQKKMQKQTELQRQLEVHKQAEVQKNEIVQRQERVVLETLRVPEKILEPKVFRDTIHLEYPSEESTELHQEIIRMVQSEIQRIPEVPKIVNIAESTKVLSEQILSRMENTGIVPPVQGKSAIKTVVLNQLSHAILEYADSRTTTEELQTSRNNRFVQSIQNNGNMPEPVQGMEPAAIVYRSEELPLPEQQEKTKQLEKQVHEVVKTLKTVEEKTIVQKEQIIEQQRQVVQEVLKNNPTVWVEGEGAGYIRNEVQQSVEEQLNQNVNQIANKVYRQLENKLKSERGRRGLI